MQTNTKPWSETAWQAALPIYEAIKTMPFITELIDGTLDRDKFIFYLQQDSLYIRQYSRVLAHIASRAQTIELTELFLKFANDGVAVEQYMHEGYLKDIPNASVMSPTCMLYTSVLRSQADEDLAVEAAAILPCFWVYWAIGQYILQNVKDLENHPYCAWIETYADASFTESNNRAIAACNALAATAGNDVRIRMTEIYVQATRLEWMFWNSAYNKEQWPI